MVKDGGLEKKCVADSAGTSNWHQGELPHYLAIKVAKKNNIDLTRQRGRPIGLADNHEFDYIIPMDQINRDNLIYEFNFSSEKVIKMREFDDESKGADVPDPYGNPVNAFEDLYFLLERCMKKFVEFLREKHNL